MLKYSARRLEARAQSECGHCRVTGDYDEFAVWPSIRLTETQFLFLEPNASDPLNKEAADDLRSNREGFKRNVRSAMGGGLVKNRTFERVLK